MECIVCNKLLLSPQRLFCSQICKSKDFHNRVKKANPNTSFSQLKRYLNRKLEYINKMGGCCSKCGYNKNLSALQFHHLDSAKKEFNLDARTIGNSSDKKLEKELEKCIVLCANCHAEHHYPENEIAKVSAFVRNSPFINKIKNSDSFCKSCKKKVWNKKTLLCKSCTAKTKRKIPIPQKEELLLLLEMHKSSNKIGKVFGLSHRPVEKWFSYHNLDYKKLRQSVQI